MVRTKILNERYFYLHRKRAPHSHILLSIYVVGVLWKNWRILVMIVLRIIRFDLPNLLLGWKKNRSLRPRNNPSQKCAVRQVFGKSTTKNSKRQLRPLLTRPIVLEKAAAKKCVERPLAMLDKQACRALFPRIFQNFEGYIYFYWGICVCI